MANTILHKLNALIDENTDEEMGNVHAIAYRNFTLSEGQERSNAGHIMDILALMMKIKRKE